MKKTTTRYYALIGIMTGLAFALYYLEVPVAFLFPAAPFLKIDFSDIPAILTGIAIGPIGGILVQFFKNLLHLLLISKEPAASGEIANFFAGVALMLPILIAYRKNAKKFGWIGIAIGTLLATVVMIFVNLYITFPLYGIPEEIRWNLINTTFTPFNLLKGAAIGIVFALLYPKLRPVIERFVSK